MADPSTEKPDAAVPASDVAAAAPDEGKPDQAELTSAEKAKSEGKERPLLPTRDASAHTRALGFYNVQDRLGCIAQAYSIASDALPLSFYVATPPASLFANINALIH
jgi:hypothetical protein